MGQENSAWVLNDSVKPETLTGRNLSAVASLIKSGKAKNIVVLTGAGISTSAGIPDFRSPETGLYANLARLNLPYAEAVFDIQYFRENPEPFYTLARELYPGKFAPTIAHAFIALLAKKNLLKMLFTQNIDCLERRAGVPDKKIVEAHGSFATQRCIECKTVYPDDEMKEKVMSGDVPHCITPQCNGLVKPDIVFFGEQLPKAFFEHQDVPAEADLMIILGTSLTVYPFASLPEVASKGVPRVLFNLERVGCLGKRADDVCVLGDCDGGVRQLAKELGWTKELEKLWESVGGRRASENENENENEEDEVEAEPLSKDEKLEAEIEKLTGEVDAGLKLSSEYTDKVKDELETKEETKQGTSSKSTGEAEAPIQNDHTTPGDSTSQAESKAEPTKVDSTVTDASVTASTEPSDKTEDPKPSSHV